MPHGVNSPRFLGFTPTAPRISSGGRFFFHFPKKRFMSTQLDPFDYHLPEELIAQQPADQRDASRLLILKRDAASPEHGTFSDLPDCLREGDLLVMNDTRVFPARLVGNKTTGGKAEILLVHPLNSLNRWEAIVKGVRNVPEGGFVFLPGERKIFLGKKLSAKTREVVWQEPIPLLEYAEHYGKIPLPPYIRRGDDSLRERDRQRYQTVYAKRTGAVAAPTAGLHFTDSMMEKLEAKGVRRTNVTLHVGPGTFLPLEDDNLRLGKLHEEWFEVPQITMEAIRDTKTRGGRVVAVGTTTVRSLEALPETGYENGYAGWTDLFIRPGFRFRFVDALVTNFHLPRSSLLMLVCAFSGTQRVLDTYEEAVKQRYRFFSYGDACFFEKA